MGDSPVGLFIDRRGMWKNSFLTLLKSLTERYQWAKEPKQEKFEIEIMSLKRMKVPSNCTCKFPL